MDGKKQNGHVSFEHSEVSNSENAEKDSSSEGYTLEQLKGKKREVIVSLLLGGIISVLVPIVRQMGGAAEEFYLAAFPYLVIGILALFGILMNPDSGDKSSGTGAAGAEGRAV